MTALQAAKNEAQRIVNYRHGEDVISFDWGEDLLIFRDGNTLEFSFEDGYASLRTKPSKRNPEGIEKVSLGAQFTIGFKTPKGYLSSKKVPVTVVNENDITLEEADELMKFNTDAVKNGFDPFWHQNEAQRRSAIGWNQVASNHLQDDCR